jgi:hypothetical protein
MRYLLGGIGLFLSLVATNIFAQNPRCQAPYHCIGVVDVGSSGSRLHLYSYVLDENQSPIHIQEQGINKVTPGFSTLELKQTKIDDYLNDLFSKTMDDDFPVYFYATAGMRLLPEFKQQAYYDMVKKWFSNQKNVQLLEAKNGEQKFARVLCFRTSKRSQAGTTKSQELCCLS